MGGLTNIIKHLIILNAIVFFGTNALMGASRIMLAMYYPASDFFRPFQIVTHMFMHADMGHLLFNMLTLFFLGQWVERLWGGRKFLFYYIFCGLGAAATHLAFMYYEINFLGNVNAMNIPVLGASGAVYGVLIAFAILFPNQRLMLLFPPIPIKAKYLAIGLICIDLFFGVSGMGSNIAHFAHLGGALFGFLLIRYWYKFGTRL
jgi:membrane associated rhomboid family serine protease